MLWVLKRTVSMRQFFLAPKHMLKIRGKKIFTILRWNFRLSKPMFLQHFFFLIPGYNRSEPRCDSVYIVYYDI